MTWARKAGLKYFALAKMLDVSIKFIEILMEKFEQLEQERQKFAEVKILSSNEINSAIECFANAIVRDWPNSKEEAVNWVSNEFHHPNSIILGAYDKDNLIGTCSLVPINFVFERLNKNEHKLVSNALLKLEIDLAKTIYFGGLSIKEKYEAQGVTTQLFTFARNSAIREGYEVLIAHTARSSEKYQKIKALSLALLKAQMKELTLPYKIFYSSPNDLEKVWLYKFLKK